MTTQSNSQHVETVNRRRESRPALAAAIDRRKFVVSASQALAVGFLAPMAFGTDAAEPLFRISLAQWSLHRALRAGEIDALDFPRVAREDFGIDAVEYVNQFYLDRGRDLTYFKKLKAVADGNGVKSLLIMSDGEGALGDPHLPLRRLAVENHRAWIEAAQLLGCHAVRVNAKSESSLSSKEQQQWIADGLHSLCEVANDYEIDVLVENHGGLSSNGSWLAGLIRMADHPRVGTLPDFGNFLMEPDPEDPAGGLWYDRYRGVRELMPWAKAVSAKSYHFDDQGWETATDYTRMMEIVLDAGYRGWVGIEYEGAALSESDGIRATKSLLERVRRELAPLYLESVPSPGSTSLPAEIDTGDNLGPW
jgi:sugar phosphate isomerase/epimerase